MSEYPKDQLKSCGEDVWINSPVSIRRPANVAIGSHVGIDEFFVCTTQLTVGDHVHISPHVTIIGGAAGSLTMGNFTNISACGMIVCASDAFHGEGLIGIGIPDEYHDRTINEPVVFEDFANTGVNVTILPGVTLPEGVAIGACSLVKKKDILKPWTIYAGNPLREIGPRDKEKMLAAAKAMGY